MAVLFQGVMVTIAGIKAVNTVAVPQGSSRVRLSMDASVFPLGNTTLSIGLSTDGGSTFQLASMVCPGGVSPNGSSTYLMDYQLAPSSVLTHAKVTVDSALGFSANTTIEAF